MIDKHIGIPIHEEQGSLRSYTYGFVYSIMLTLAAYLIVVYHLYSITVTITIIATLALAQLLVQLIFFLHLSKESKPRWKLAVFILMVTIIVIIAGGSLWIMQHLNHYNHSASAESAQQYIIRDEGIHK